MNKAHHYIVAKFETPALAQEYVNAADTRLVVVRGDDNTLWVVTPAHAEKLYAARFNEVLIARKSNRNARRNRTSRTGSWIA